MKYIESQDKPNHSNEIFKEYDELDEDDEIEEDFDTEEDSTECEIDNKTIIYKKRLRKLIIQVAEEELSDIRISKKGMLRLQDSIKFLSVALTYEIIDLLKAQGRKTIKPFYVDEALTRMLISSDALSISTDKLEQLVSELQNMNRNTSLNRAMDFINLSEDNKEGES